jgi:hypothetical protein
MPDMGNGIVLIVDPVGACGKQATVTEFLEQLEKPLLASKAGAEIRRGKGCPAFLKAKPQGLEPGPRSADGLVELLSSTQVIVLGLEAGQISTFKQTGQ